MLRHFDAKELCYYCFVQRIKLIVFCVLLQRDFGDKRVFSERRRNDSYAEEEPEWFSGGPTSQSETIELIGFDDKILEDDKRRTKRSRKKPESVKEGMYCTNVENCKHLRNASVV